MEATIKVEHMSKAYNGVPAVQDMNMAIGRGEIFGLLGANGAGKSTTIECILGTIAADSGKISILGMNPVVDRKKVFERVGVQFQEAHYPDKIKVYELCEEMASLYSTVTDYRQLLEKFGLDNKKNSYIQELSGGQKQRLFIVLALLPNPEVVFLDELTTGLDTRAKREVWKWLSSLKEKGLTIVLTSHDMDEVEALCDRIAILKQGSTIFCGTVKEAVEASPYEQLEEAYLWYTDEEEYKHDRL